MLSFPVTKKRTGDRYCERFGNSRIARMGHQHLFRSPGTDANCRVCTISYQLCSNGAEVGRLEPDITDELCVVFVSGQVSRAFEDSPLMETRNTGRKILVPLDGSASSERALAHALWMMVTQATDHLLLLHVHESNGAETQPPSSALVPTYDDKVIDMHKKTNMRVPVILM